MKRLIAIPLAVLALFVSTPARAHVGSADVYYEGDTGPYHLFVTIRLPQVIPGVAEMQIRSATPDVQTVKVVLLRLTGPGSNLPAVPDIAKRSETDQQFFVSNLWLMEYGALQARIEVDGSKGKAKLSIPVASFARQPLPMSAGLRWLGLISLLALTLSAVPIIGAIVREGSLASGQAPLSTDKRRSRNAMAIALAMAILMLYLNRALWSQQAAMYDRNVNLLKPPRAETTLLDGDRLQIRAADPLLVPVAGRGKMATEVKLDEVIPDHGHVMHLFLLGQPGMQTMWHLHPDHAQGEVFSERLPAMPEGQYQVFADVVDKNGFPWTLVANVHLPRINGSPLLGDDSKWSGQPLNTSSPDTNSVELPDGSHVIWERGNDSLKANIPTSFRFRVEQKDGSPARDLQPYMGMAAHAEVVCSDLSVFAHIHPNGSVAMASLDLAQTALMSSNGTSAMSMDMAPPGSALPAEFSFPYGFPHAGEYRVFVQIKRRSGDIQTAAFTAHVL